MSMDLQVQFPRIGVRIPPPISLRSTDPDRDHDRCLGEAETGIPPENHSSSEVEQDELCRTPRSEKNRIPQLSSPPPAPRKKRQPPVSKRKLRMDLDQFFEIVNRSEELDEFFRSGFEFASRIAKRNKCVMA